MLQNLPHEISNFILNILDNATLKVLAEIKCFKPVMSKHVLVIKLTHSNYDELLFDNKVIESDEHFTNNVYSIKAETEDRNSTERYLRNSTERYWRNSSGNKNKSTDNSTKQNNKLNETQLNSNIDTNSNDNANNNNNNNNSNNNNNNNTNNVNNNTRRRSKKPCKKKKSAKEKFIMFRNPCSSDGKFINYEKFQDKVVKNFKIVIIEVKDIQSSYPNSKHLFNRFSDPVSTSKLDIFYRQPLIELTFPIKELHKTNWVHLELQEELNVPLNDLLGHLIYSEHFNDSQIANSALKVLFLLCKNPLDFKLSYNSVKRQLVMNLLSYESLARYYKIRDRFNQLFMGIKFYEWDKLDGLSFIFYFSECYPNFNQTGNLNEKNDIDDDDDYIDMLDTIKLMESKYRKILQSIIMDEFNLRYSRLQFSKSMKKSTYYRFLSYRFHKVPYNLRTPVWDDCSLTDPEFFHNTHYRYFWILSIIDLLKDKFQTQITSIRINLANKCEKFENLDGTKRTYQEYSNYLKHFIELKNSKILKMKIDKLINPNRGQSHENDSNTNRYENNIINFDNYVFVDYRMYVNPGFNNDYNDYSSSNSSTFSRESKRCFDNRLARGIFEKRHAFYYKFSIEDFNTLRIAHKSRIRLSKIRSILEKIKKSKIWKSVFKNEY
ncbi:hypothetical protein WICMUC_000431 [Wickerhamomyces mucosus]|uniref:Uncharacterized protein n=1 Tax=Wickerhamomyces mucosus TaxID=1378264 RepID=A0A9P8PZ75_9ASCO|nr:hypothetical protein WICMUC_000431 [Wickerhamomyces mucosus]